MNKVDRIKHTIDLVVSGILKAPDSFVNAEMFDLKDTCNGCGPASAKIDCVPDTIWGTYIGFACYIHDWMYFIGSTKGDKIDADKLFLSNINAIIDCEKAWYKPKLLMKARAYGYYLTVRMFGNKAFWEGKQN